MTLGMAHRVSGLFGELTVRFPDASRSNHLSRRGPVLFDLCFVAVDTPSCEVEQPRSGQKHGAATKALCAISLNSGLSFVRGQQIDHCDRDAVARGDVLRTCPLDNGLGYVRSPVQAESR